MNYTSSENKINTYINNIIKLRCIGGIDLYYKGLNEHILKKYNIDNPFTNKVISYNQREIKNTEKHFNPTIRNTDIIKIKNYLNTIYNNTEHLLNKYLKKAVDENIINFGFTDNIMPYACLGLLVEKIMKNFYILDLYEKDCKNLIKEKRDKKKIINAIDLIQSYTTDEHLLYELEIEKNNIIHINKTVLLSSFFYDFTSIIKKIFEKNNNVTISQINIQKLANDIMYAVFEVNKDYRITKHVISTTYKNNVLYRYSYNQEMDKRIAFYKKHPLK